MFKAVLCLIIIISSGALGLLKSQAFSQRIRELNDLRSMVRQLNTEINYRKDPLITTFNRIASQNSNTSSKLLSRCSEYMTSYKEFGQCWNAALEEVCADTSLKKEDKAILAELGAQLGKSSIEGQSDMFRLTEEKLLHQINLAVKEKDSKGKMFGGLGFSLGIVISVLLI
jgi:stage III sporulation protein AB